jgi:hypothetical protein
MKIGTLDITKYFLSWLSFDLLAIITSKWLRSTPRRVATRTQKRSCVHIENFDKNENMVNLGHKVE